MDRSIRGRIHSQESFGAVDGPGLRYVVFLQGCPLRCLYCHNPDSRAPLGGTAVTAGELLDEILSYHTFIRHGGVTLSGGEPLAQSAFCAALLEGLGEAGIHRAIDTSGAIPLEQCRPAVDQADLLLLDVKDFDTGVCRELTGMGNENGMRLLDYCESVEKPVWVRQVLVPGWTMDRERLTALAEYLRKFRCVQRVELLPFHKHGEFKWKELGLSYTLAKVPEPQPDQVEEYREIFRSRGFFVQ